MALINFSSLKISQSNFRVDVRCDKEISVHIVDNEWSVCSECIAGFDPSAPPPSARMTFLSKGRKFWSYAIDEIMQNNVSEAVAATAFCERKGQGTAKTFVKGALFTALHLLIKFL